MVWKLLPIIIKIGDGLFINAYGKDKIFLEGFDRQNCIPNELDNVLSSRF